MTEKTTGSGNPFTRARRGGYARLASIVGTALASHLIASPALLSNETPAPTTHLVPLFPEGHDGPGKEGLIRVANYSMEHGTVRIAAFDEDGRHYEPVTLTIGGGETIHLDADDLVQGNPAKGVSGATGPGWGDGRLELSSELDIMVSSYIRHRDGLLTSMHDVVPRAGNRHYATFNPGSSTEHLANLSTQPRRDPVLVEDHFVETTKGNPDGVVVSVVDDFGPGTHGERITGTFLDNTRHAALVQIGGWGEYRLNGQSLRGTNIAGYIRHVLTRGRGIFWTATDDSPAYWPDRPGWLVENGRPFPENVREFANWMRNQDVLFISSLENATCRRTPDGRCVAVYCDDFELDEEGWWIPLCGVVDDYVAHSGVGLDIVLFAGALQGNHATGAIRADGVFAPHTIYVESPGGSTSHATAVLAAYATNLSFANPSWGAARLKRELMALAREETVRYFIGVDERGTTVTEPRTVRAIRPPANRPPETIGTLPPRTLAPGTAQIVDVSQAFVDPDGDTLSHAASSSAPSVVTARTAGARVTLTAFSEGSSTIQVTATDPGGLSAVHSMAVTVSTSFTDDPIQPGATPVRAAHFAELRARIDRARQAAGLRPYAWTDPVLTTGVTSVKLVHLLELRTALERAYTATGRSAPRWSDPTPVAAATVIRAVHLTELRAGVVALE